jgi:hypothetical protein
MRNAGSDQYEDSGDPEIMVPGKTPHEPLLDTPYTVKSDPPLPSDLTGLPGTGPSQLTGQSSENHRVPPTPVETTPNTPELPRDLLAAQDLMKSSDGTMPILSPSSKNDGKRRRTRSPPIIHPIWRSANT